MALEQRCWVDISLGAFARNVRHARETLAGDSALMVAVKSNAYGHGGRELAKVAVTAGAAALAVLDIDTGLHLRGAIPDVPMLAWLLSPGCDFAAASAARITLGISHGWQLDKIARECRGLHTTVHLKIDTGLHRNGALAKDWPGLVAYAAELQNAGLITVEGVWSHLADTSPDEDAKSLGRFKEAVGLARAAGLSPGILHIAASAAATDFPDARLDMVRVGISVYGVSPFEDRSAEDMGFVPVMSTRALVSDVDPVNNRAVVAMGTGDGLFGVAPGQGWVSLCGSRVPIDSIHTDHLVLALPKDLSVAPGDVATLWGAPTEGSPRAEDWALWAETIGDEIVTAMPQSLPRRFIAD